jgi:hypothetical protein
MEHGALAYRSSLCRCDACTDDHRDRQWRESQARRERLKAGTASPSVHGASTYANWGCRCETCTEANTARARAWRAAAGRP